MKPTKIRSLLLVLLVAVEVAGCWSSGPTTPPAGDKCADVCRHLGPEGLNCPSFGPTPGQPDANGVLHPVACETWLCGSYGVKTKCLLRATTCSEADDFQTHGTNECPSP